MSKYLDIPARFITESAYDSVIESDKTVENVQPVEEVYEECDMFIELGDSMFYVSEYHNALFDDPDAHDEVINEFGILLDSYDDDLIEETFKPYDEYLKKHGYDRKTNSIVKYRTEQTPEEIWDRVNTRHRSTIDSPWDPHIDDPHYDGPIEQISYDDFLRLGEKHHWRWPDGTPMLEKVYRINAGRIGSKKERNRLNKFLRENGYDPKTETILTDIDDKDNPGAKKRVKFGLHAAIGDHTRSMSMPVAYSRIDNDGTLHDTAPGIAMSKQAMQQKPGNANFVLKHEEGHLAYEDAFDKAQNGSWNYDASHKSPKKFRSDINDAREHVRRQLKKNPSLSGNEHDILPTEYQADKYGDEHNRYGRGYGTRSLKLLTNLAMKHQDISGIVNEVIDTYGDGKKAFEQVKKDTIASYNMSLSALESLKKSDPKYKILKANLAKLKKEIDSGFPTTKGLCASISADRAKSSKALDKYQRDTLQAGIDSRDAFMKKHAEKANSKKSAEEAKKRQLSKEQLQKQLDSGKLSKEQAAKASKKIARIQQFEERQGKAPQPSKKSSGKNSAKKK